MRPLRFIILSLVFGALVQAQFFRTIWETMEFPADSEIAFCYGCKHCAAGDVNADGYDDFLVTKGYGVNCLDTTKYDEVYLFFGGPSLSALPGMVFRGQHVDSYGNECFGAALKGLGDVNGDGYDDFGISAPRAFTGPERQAGRLDIYFGGPGLDTIPDLTLHGDRLNRFGGSIASDLCGADVNGDGVNDLIVGSADYSTYDPVYNYTMRGRIYVHYGGAGIDTVPDLIINGGHYWIPFIARYEQLGFCLDNCGDVNGDGFDDIIAGAPNNMERDSVAGKAYLFYGGQPIDTLPDWWFWGENYWQMLGTRVSNAGDFNGDGFQDIMIGDCFWPEEGYPSWGRVLMFFGGPELDTIPDWKIEGILWLTGNLGSDVDAVADLNRDGYDDIIVSNFGYNPPGNQYPGRFLLYYGGAEPDTFPDAQYVGQPGWEVNTGWNLCAAGDLNADGFQEILFGTNYPPIVPYPDVYGWERVMKYVETAVPDTVRISGGDVYVVARWQARHDSLTREYRLLRNVFPDTNGWSTCGVLPAGPLYCQIFDSTLAGNDSFYYWLKITAWNGRQDLFGPFPGRPSLLSVQAEAYWQAGGQVRLAWQVTGGDVAGFNVYRRQAGATTKLNLLPLSPDKAEYYDAGSDASQPCSWYLDVIQGSGAVRRFGPYEAGGVILIRPNPCRGSANIGVRLSQSGTHRLEVYDVSGRRVKTLWSGRQEAGLKETVWNADDDRGRRLAAGVYYVVYQMGDCRNTAKIVLTK